MAKQPFAVHVTGEQKPVPSVHSRVAPIIPTHGAPPPTAPPQPSISLAKIVEAMKESHEPLAALLSRLSDDLYNAAVLQNPLAFVTTQMPQSDVSIPDADTLVALHQNRLHGPVVVVVRSDNAPNNDVSQVLLTSSQSANTTRRAQVHAAGTTTIAAVLRPGHSLFVGARALTFPVRAYFTVVPLNGRSGLFE